MVKNFLKQIIKEKKTYLSNARAAAFLACFFEDPSVTVYFVIKEEPEKDMRTSMLQFPHFCYLPLT
jgi:hypothetical protein